MRGNLYYLWKLNARFLATIGSEKSTPFTEQVKLIESFRHSVSVQFFRRISGSSDLGYRRDVSADALPDFDANIGVKGEKEVDA